MAQAADLVLCLFPFEPACYEGLPIRAEFVGHPFAQEIEAVADRGAAREQLGLDANARVLALLPGSRQGELSRNGQAFAGAARWLHQRLPDVQFLVPAADPEIGEYFRQLCAREGEMPLRIVDGQSRLIVRAADVAIVTSGTATLETMLLGTPFVVTYRAAPFTAWLLRNAGMLKVSQVAMPNILAGRELAPELIQEAAQAELLGAAAYQLLTRPHLRQAQLAAFEPVCQTLRRPTSETAARAVMALCSQE